MKMIVKHQKKSNLVNTRKQIHAFFYMRPMLPDRVTRNHSENHRHRYSGTCCGTNTKFECGRAKGLIWCWETYRLIPYTLLPMPWVLTKVLPCPFFMQLPDLTLCLSSLEEGKRLRGRFGQSCLLLHLCSYPSHLTLFNNCRFTQTI